MTGAHASTCLDPASECKNEYGSIRLNKVHYSFGRDRNTGKQLSPLNVEKLKPVYLEWRDTDEFVPVKHVFREYKIIDCGTVEAARNYVLWVYKHTNIEPKPINGVGAGEWVSLPSERDEWRFYPAVKRGNEAYLRLIEERFKPLLDRPSISFFKDDSYGHRKTKMLYVTVTTDPVTTGHDLGWLEFSKRWNTFITNLRNQYGKIVFLRAWQSQDNGLPHAHALLYFVDQDFTAIYWKEDKSYRLPSRDKRRAAIKDAWSWGFCDIKCIDDTREAFKDLLKYVTRDLEGGASDLTNTLVWYFERRSFSMSESRDIKDKSGNVIEHRKGFVESIFGDVGSIDLAEPVDADLISSDLYNSNSELLRIEIYPTVRRDLLSFSQQMTIYDYDTPPPVSEGDVQILEHLTNDLVLTKCKNPSKKFNCPVYLYKRR